MTDRTDTAVADTRRWLERAVIGLNLCPFAKSVHVKGQVHYAVSAATDGRGLRDDLLRELRDLAAINPEVRDTTLLVAPDAFPDFLDFNDFLATADRALAGVPPPLLSWNPKRQRARGGPLADLLAVRGQDRRARERHLHAIPAEGRARVTRADRRPDAPPRPPARPLPP